MKAKRVWSAVLCAGLALSMCVNAGAAAQNVELRPAMFRNRGLWSATKTETWP